MSNTAIQAGPGVKRYRNGIMGTICVPWNEDFTFNAELFRWQAAHLIRHGVHDLYIFGTAGEGHAVNDRQFEEITRTFLDATREPGVQPMVGIISMSLPTIIDRIKRSMDLGATRFQISLPSWGKLSDAEVDRYFDDTCGAFPQCEFMHYNVLRAHRLLTGGEYARLAARHPNLVAAKNGSPDGAFVRSLVTEAPMLQHFITERGFSEAALAGECGLLISISSIHLGLARQYFRAGQRQDEPTLRAMQQELAQLIAELLRSLEGVAHMDGAFDKIFCRMHDDRFSLRLLPPYACASEEAYQYFLQTVKARFPRWVSQEK